LDYDPQSIVDWGTRIAAQSWQAVYAYFKHEALGPMFAEALLSTSNGQAMADLSAVRASIAAPSSKPKRTTRSSASPTEAKPLKLPGSSKPSKSASTNNPSRLPNASKPPQAPAARTSKAPKKSS
jgi:hypothetical protein